MAIVFEGQSTCPICDAVLDRNKAFILVPAMMGNAKDPLFVFNDEGIHVECLNNHKFKNKLQQHIRLYNEHMPPSKLKCVIDGEIIGSPEKLLFFGLLTSDETEELYAFNYLSFNLDNIGEWKELDRFLSVSEKFLSEDKWEGLTEFNELRYIIAKIKKSC